MEMKIFALLQTTVACPSLFIRANPNKINWKSTARPCHNTWLQHQFLGTIRRDYFCAVLCNLMVISHPEQIIGTSNQLTFAAIINNFSIQFVKCDFLQYMQADILKREDKILLFQLASWPSECFYFSASHFLPFYFFPLFIIASCCGADGQKC